MRSRRSVALFLLDKAGLLAWARGHFAFLHNRWWSHLSPLGPLLLRPWFGPGLLIAALLILLSIRRSDARRSEGHTEPQPSRRPARRPSLEAFRGLRPRHHPDLEP